MSKTQATTTSSQTTSQPPQPARRPQFFHRLQTKSRQFTYKLKHDWLTFNNVILLLAGVFCFSWTWGSTSSMSRNWELAQTLAERQKELTLLQLEVETLELENEYYQSVEYQELAARRQQNKLAPGETMIYLPENSTTAKTKYQTESTVATTTEQSNFRQWLAFLFGV